MPSQCRVAGLTAKQLTDTFLDFATVLDRHSQTNWEKCLTLAMFLGYVLSDAPMEEQPGLCADVGLAIVEAMAAVAESR